MDSQFHKLDFLDLLKIGNSVSWVIYMVRLEMHLQEQATPYYAEQGHFYLESNNVKDGQINHNSEIFINDEFYEKQKDKWLHTGDMVMVQSGHVGHAAVIPEELDNTAAHALIMFRNPKEKIEPYF